MTDETVVAIAHIPLARSVRRVLAGPGVLLLAGALAAAGGWMLGGVPGVALIVAGGILGLSALYLALMVLSVRLDVEVSTLRIRQLGSDQRFTLVRGPVTRVPLRGEGAARLQPRFGALGWGLGPARLRGEEEIHLVRLAPTGTAILVPTDAGRVAIAPASEQHLITALGAAARVQQRLDQVAARARSRPIDRLVEEPEPAPAAPSPPPPPPAPAEPEPGRLLTGIERVMLEQRLAAERAAALAAAEAERQRAVEEAAAAAEAARLAAEQALLAPPRPERRLPRIAVRSIAIPRVGVPRVGVPRVTVPRVALPRPTVRLPSVAGPRRQVVVEYLVAAVPLAAATGLWAVASLAGRLDLADSPARLTALSLALAGPGASVGALAARAWFPRLIGPVLVTALCALLLAGRALFA